MLTLGKKRQQVRDFRNPADESTASLSGRLAVKVRIVKTRRRRNRALCGWGFVRRGSGECTAVACLSDHVFMSTDPWEELGIIWRVRPKTEERRKLFM